MKDFDTLAGEITDPKIKKQLASEADRLKAEKAFDLLNDELDEAFKAKAQLPEVLGKLDALEKAVARPLSVTATTKAPAAPKPAVKAPTMLEVVSLAVAAEVVRRRDNTPIKTFLNEARPGDRFKLVRKAATEVATTTNPGWAHPLTDTILGAEFVDRVPTAILPQLLGAGARLLDFKGANAVTHPRRNRGTLPADWVAESKPIPVKQGSFGSNTLNRYKLAVLATMSNEIQEVSAPQIVDVVQAGIVEDTAVALDGYFLDAEPITTSVRPAGILNGAASQASAGNTVEDVHTDLKWLLGQLIAVRARKPVFIINPLRVASLSLLTTTGTGVRPFQAELERGTLAGVPLIVADNAPTDTVIGMDADSLFLGIDAPMFDFSDQAMIIMSDDPENDTGVRTRSLFQTLETAVRYVLPASWGLGRDGTVSQLTGVNW